MVELEAQSLGLQGELDDFLNKIEITHSLSLVRFPSEGGRLVRRLEEQVKLRVKNWGVNSGLIEGGVT